jgi:hypothetical protein
MLIMWLLQYREVIFDSEIRYIDVLSQLYTFTDHLLVKNWSHNHSYFKRMWYDLGLSGGQISPLSVSDCKWYQLRSL